MDLKEFTFMVRDNITDYLSAFDVEKVYERDVIKNNGVVYKGIVITLKDKEASPTIYMDYYYELYKNGKDFDELMKIIYENYRKSVEKLEKTEEEAEKLERYEEKLFIKVVNYEKNKKFLEDCPYIKFLDMALTFRYLVHKDEKEISSALVKFSLMDTWGINTHSLYKIANNNTKILFPPIMKKMSEVLKMCDDNKVCIPDNLMYVLTNESYVNGASYIAYKEILEKAYNKIKKDYYILPSSIHELIIVPYDLGEADMLKMFVKGVNETALPPVDFLSDNVYYYSHESGIKII